jgi:hypothetical protein
VGVDGVRCGRADRIISLTNQQELIQKLRHEIVTHEHENIVTEQRYSLEKARNNAERNAKEREKIW